MKSRILFATAATAALLAVGGCGGDESSGSDLAGLAPPNAPIFMEATLRPTGELKANADAAAKQIAGVDSLGGLIVEELESTAADEGEPFDYAKEVEPWLGDRGGLFFEKLDRDNDPTGLGIMVESTDAGATREFIDNQVEESKDPYRSASYEGVDYEVGGDEDQAIGVVGDFLALGEDEQVFEEMVDASSGEALADQDTFSKAIAAASDGSLADFYLDAGSLIEQSGGGIDPTARQFLQSAGIDPSEATAVASVLPGEDQIAVELSSDLAGQEAPSGDASELLGSLPGNAFAGFAVSGFGKQLQEAIDALDEQGISGTVPPHQLKKGLKQLGIDLESFADSLRDAGIFAVGSSKSSLGGALVLTSEGERATETVSNIIKLLRGVQVQGVTVLRGKYEGFAVHSDELGEKQLVVAAREGRIAIGYGLPATLLGLAEGKGRTLSDNPAYGDAVDSLEGTPISAFADGAGALRLADALIPASDEGFEEAKKYLRGIRFLALGSASQDELATAKLMVGIK
jgi:uncharacterized protein DUF3352